MSSWNSGSPYVPLHLLDTDLLAGLFIVVKPLSLRQIDVSKLTTRIGALGEPLSLPARQASAVLFPRDQGGVLTSGLNSVNSRPRQSNSRTFCGLGGSDCSYGTGAALMEADDSL